MKTCTKCGKQTTVLYCGLVCSDCWNKTEWNIRSKGNQQVSKR